MFEKFTLEQFVTDAASAKPTPGGGSVAALTASCGAALMAMLCNLTAGKKGFENFFDEMSRLAEKYSAAAKDFLADIDRDVEAFGGYMSALRLPKDTEAQKAERAAALVAAADVATNAPLSVAVKAEALLDDAAYILKNGNPSAVSDGVIAVRLLAAAVDAALCNVEINLPYIKDAEKRAAVKSRADGLKKSAGQKAENILKGIEL